MLCLDIIIHTSFKASVATPSSGGDLDPEAPVIEKTALNDTQSHDNMVICDPLAVISGTETHEDTPMANLSFGSHLRGAAPSAIGASATSGSQTHEITPIDNLDSGRCFGGAESNAAEASGLSGSQTPEDTHLDDLTSDVQLGSRESGPVRTADGHVRGRESDVVGASPFGGSQNYDSVQTLTRLPRWII